MALYAAAGLALLVVVGWGKLGADVGGVITIGAGVAVATLVMTPGTRRSAGSSLTALVPVGALGVLIAIDLGLSGGSHLTRNLLRASDAGELLELVTRRYELAWRVLIGGNKPALFLGAVLAIAFAWRNRERLYGALPHRAWAAALARRPRGRRRGHARQRLRAGPAHQRRLRARRPDRVPAGPPRRGLTASVSRRGRSSRRARRPAPS